MRCRQAAPAGYKRTRDSSTAVPIPCGPSALLFESGPPAPVRSGSARR